MSEREIERELTLARSILSLAIAFLCPVPIKSHWSKGGEEGAIPHPLPPSNGSRMDVREPLLFVQSPINFKTREEIDSDKRQQRLKLIRQLISDIEHCAAQLPHIGEPVPALWVDIRQAVENDSRNYIYSEQFFQICYDQGITDERDIVTLLSYFHDLGIVLHFADNPLLRDRVIFKPAWATNAVYRIFDNDLIKDKQGRFTRADCSALWSDTQYNYMHDVLIALMKNFHLVYEIGNTDNLIAPQMLPQDTPNYTWDDTNNSLMQFRYDLFMPQGILWQFIVTMYRYIKNHDWVWRNGVILERNGTSAEVKENLSDRRIYLRFSGTSIAEFRAIIADRLDEISQSYHKLKYDKMVPCSCSICRSSSQPHFFKFSVLKKRQVTGKKHTIECEISEEDVPLNLLLEGFELPQITDKPLDDNREIKPEPNKPMKTIKIFLASSSELEKERDEFEIFIRRKNDNFRQDGIYLELVRWENFIDAMSQTRLQDEYNKAVADCDIFVSLFHTKVGKYTEEEFEKAFQTFKANDKPLIYTYFNQEKVEITPELVGVINFQKKLGDLGHYYTKYDGIKDLKFKFSEQLEQVLPQLTGNTINQIPSSSNPDEPGIKDLLTQLQEAIDDPQLSEEDKNQTSEQLQILAEAGQNPKDETMQKKAKKAVGFLKVIAEGVEPATKLAQACAKVLPKILAFFA